MKPSGFTCSRAWPTRLLRLIRLLLPSRLSVNEIARGMHISPYNVSKHLRVLKEAGIVRTHKIGTFREYEVSPSVRQTLRRSTGVLDLGCCRFQFDKLLD